MQIPVSKFFTMPIEVKAGSVVEWHWALESGNINSIVRFKANGQTQEQEVYKGERITDHKGNFSVPEDGTISFFFDNSFSWLASKVVVGMIDIHSCVCAKQPNPSFLDATSGTVRTPCPRSRDCAPPPDSAPALAACLCTESRRRPTAAPCCTNTGFRDRISLESAS